MDGIKEKLTNLLESFLRLVRKVVLALKVVVGVIVAYLLYVAAVEASWAFTSGEETITVNQVVGSGESGGSRFMVLTTTGPFSNTDSYIRGKRDSATLQSMLAGKGTYRCVTQGYRFPWRDKTVNLISCVKQTTEGNAQ